MLAEKIDTLNWHQITADLNTNGYAVVPAMLDPDQCQQLIKSWDEQTGFRKTVNMARYRFGQGQYKYWDYPLPDLVATLRRDLYPHLAPTANLWMQQLGMDKHFPPRLADMTKDCHAAGQMKPTPLILRYDTGGHNTLHQDLYGDVFFPIQAAFMLNQPDTDFDGGEFVLTQQVPRAQSKAVVLTPNRGDMILFTTNFRPVKGSRGYYRAIMKHGVSEIRRGRRHCMGIIFHDATS